jgi:2-polyprenyl-3-methyl-5-hydroxy-6-metoxy-1,4-benzoquinol methylase
MPTQATSIIDVERWNDTFARTHDIDDYYSRSSFLIRWIEQRRLAIIKDMIAAQPDDHILEIGCGGGHVLRLFPESDLTGVDVSGEMLRRAQRNLQGYRTTLIKGELHELDLPQAGFDKIICTEVLEHVVDPDALLDGMKRLVRPGGRIVITFPNDQLVDRIKRAIRRCRLTGLPPFRRVAWGGDEYHLHVWRVTQMRTMLTQRFAILRERFAPGGWLPVRCCFLCSAVA